MPDIFRDNKPIVHISFFHDRIDNSVPLLRFYTEEDVLFDLLLYDAEKQMAYSLVDAQVIFRIKQKRCDDEYMYTYDSNANTTHLLITNPETGYMNIVIPKAEVQALGVGAHPFHVTVIKGGQERIVVKDHVNLLEV